MQSTCLYLVDFPTVHFISLFWCFILKSCSGCWCQLTALPPFVGDNLTETVADIFFIHLKDVHYYSINQMSAKPTCLVVASASPQGKSASLFHVFVLRQMLCFLHCFLYYSISALLGVSTKSFQQCFNLCSSVFNLQTATQGVRCIHFS